jgi:hypothetical protein
MLEPPGLNAAMQRYLTVVANGDVSGFIDLATDQGKFRFSSYNSSGNMIGLATYTKSELRAELASEGGLYYAIFGGDANYKYRDRIAGAPLSTWNRIDLTFRWEQGPLKSYVRWHQEDGDWKFYDVGDTVPE